MRVPQERVAVVGAPAAAAEVLSLLSQAGVTIVSRESATVVIAAARGDLDSESAALRAAVGNPAPGVLVALDLDRHRVADFADLWPDPGRIVGLRALRHAPGRGVVEVVAGPRTSRASLYRARRFAHGLGCVPVRCADRPGFILGTLARAASGSGHLDDSEDTDWSTVLTAAAELLDSGACSIRDLTMAAREGLGWSSDPLSIINDMWEQKRAEELPDSFRIRRQVRAGVPFGQDEVRIEVHDEIASLCLCRPHALNALEPELLLRLEEAFDRVESRTEVRTVVFRSDSTAFLAGVEANWILERMEADDFASILEFVERGQELLRRIEQSPKRTLLRLEGLAAGAGGELLCCVDGVIASPRGAVLFPETSIGIYPAMGGTQRLPRRIGRALARWLLLSGEALRCGPAVEIGLFDRVVDPEGMDDAIEEWHHDAQRSLRAPSIHVAPARIDGLADVDLSDLQRAFEHAEIEAIRRGKAEDGLPRVVRGAFRRIRHRAPRALEITDRLIRLSGHTPLEVGLRAELEHLREIFDTQDALEGVRARAAGRRAVSFTGS